jgi:hypothetical protein
MAEHAKVRNQTQCKPHVAFVCAYLLGISLCKEEIRHFDKWQKRLNTMIHRNWQALFQRAVSLINVDQRLAKVKVRTDARWCWCIAPFAIVLLLMQLYQQYTAVGEQCCILCVSSCAALRTSIVSRSASELASSSATGAVCSSLKIRAWYLMRASTTRCCLASFCLSIARLSSPAEKKMPANVLANEFNID